MKSLLKLVAIAAAFGLAPAAMAQSPAAPEAQPGLQPSAPPSDAISAQSQAAPAQPAEASDPAVATIPNEAPSDSQVAQAISEATHSPVQGIGQPDGRMGLQQQFTPIGEEAAWFHDYIILPAIAAVSILVLVLLVWVILRYRRSANPTPSRTTHNTALEVVWTLVPVLILVLIAVPSIRLLAHQYSPPEADLTVKAIGNQWYWIYEYPDHGIELVSNMLSDEQAEQRGEPRMLGVDERLVVPVGATVKVIVTSNDVIHAWGVPAFWVKIDAVPGRLNETWFKADRPGVYYGVCYELCGARHGYMPIAVEVVAPDRFAAWVAAKGGAMPGSEPEAEAPAQPGLAAGDSSEAAPAPTNIVEGTAAAPALSSESTQTE